MGYYNYNFALGNRLKELRARSGKTLEKSAEETNVDPKTVANWERGMKPKDTLLHKHLDTLNASHEERIELVLLAYGRR